MTGSVSGSMRIWMDRGLSGSSFDEASALECQDHLVTEGGVTRKWRCMSASAAAFVGEL